MADKWTPFSEGYGVAVIIVCVLAWWEVPSVYVVVALIGLMFAGSLGRGAWLGHSQRVERERERERALMREELHEMIRRGQRSVDATDPGIPQM
jgi:hypothetical protein